jgi:hypothetical protein
VLGAARVTGNFPQTPCTLAGGAVTLGSQLQDNLVRAPMTYVGQIRVDLLFEDGSAVNATATELRLDLIGSPTYIQPYPGGDD